MKPGFGRIEAIFRKLRGAAWTFQQDLALHYTSRSGLDFLETGSGSNRNAKIIPSCGKIDGSNYLVQTINDFEASDNDGFVEIEFYYTSGATTIVLFTTTNSASNTTYFDIGINISQRPYLIMRSFSNFTNNMYGNVALSTGVHTIRWTSTGSSYTLTQDGLSTAFTTSSGLNDGKWFNDNFLSTDRNRIAIGARITSTTSVYCSAAANIYKVNYNDEHKWIITGEGANVFDSIGTSHLSWVGSDHHSYSINAPQDLLNYGYSIWVKSGSVNEFVPYKSGLPNNVSSYLVGYSKLADYPGNITAYNFAPSLVDFDYLDTGDASLISLNKSSSSHYITTTSMIYYDASNIYRWRQDELSSPQIYSDTYKKVGYKGIWMIKGTVTSPKVVSMNELLVYTKDQKYQSEWGLAQYCNLQDLVVQNDSRVIYDDNNYLVWI